MIFLIPILIVIAIIVAIDQLYFTEPPLQPVEAKKEFQQKPRDTNATQKYLDRYIKK